MRMDDSVSLAALRLVWQTRAAGSNAASETHSKLTRTGHSGTGNPACARLAAALVWPPYKKTSESNKGFMWVPFRRPRVGTVK